MIRICVEGNYPFFNNLLIENEIQYIPVHSLGNISSNRYSNTHEYLFDEHNLEKFLKLFTTIASQNNLIAYRVVEENRHVKYIPLIILNENNKKFRATFFMKRLSDPTVYIPKDREKYYDNGILKHFEIQFTTPTHGEGYYQEITGPGHDTELFHDTGIFTTELITKEEEYLLQINVQNVRFINRNAENIEVPIDHVLPMPHHQGMKSFHFEEHFRIVKDQYVIHYADDVPIIEVYEIDPDLHVMNEYPKEVIERVNLPKEMSLNQQVEKISSSLVAQKMIKERN